MSYEELSVWIGRLKEGDNRAVEVIWKRCFEKLVKLARKRLGNMPRRTDDEEDVALSAMNSFYRAVQRGRLPEMEDRDDLWRILATITSRKIGHRNRKHFSAKRGGGTVRGESVFANAFEGANLGQVQGKAPTPDLAVETAETCLELIGKLGDPSLAQLVVLKLEGRTNSEVAATLNCATRTVERKLEKVRECWGKSVVE